MPPIWPMTVGMAVETTEASSDTRKVATNRASVIRRRSDTRTRYREGAPTSRIAAFPDSGGSGGGGGGGGFGQPDAHDGAAAFAGAAGPDAAVVLLDDVAADVQAQPHAGDLPMFGVRRAAEGLEDAFGGLRRQADTMVLHLEQHAARLGLEADPQLGAIGRILDRVLEQIGQDLFDALRVGRHVRGLPADVEQERARAAQLLLVATDDL